MIDKTLLFAIGGIWGLLALASAIVFAMVKLNPQKNLTELAQRTKSWWVMVAAFTFAMLTDTIVSFCFIGFISFLALKEYFSLIPTRREDRRVLFWAYLAIPLQYYWAGTNWYGMFIIFIPVYMFLFIAFRMIISQKTEGFLNAAATIHWGLMLCVFAISHAAYLISLTPAGSEKPVGPMLLLFLAFLTQFNDVAQYVWGKSFGKHHILPIVSPKKTWEGFIGGLCTTTLAAFLIAPFLTPFSKPESLFVGALIAAAGFIGDVTISSLKRDIGVKDAGSMIPGHGGVLDRVNSLTFAAPLFLHYTRYFYF